MLLGSHNSLSYGKVTKWWMNLISWAARCQSRSYVEQYALGVRVFDVRIRWDEIHKCWKPAHGPVMFEHDIHRLFRYLDIHRMCKVRLILEYNKAPKNEDFVTRQFTEDIFRFKNEYPFIEFFELRRKWDWGRMVHCTYNPNIYQYVGSMAEPKSFIGKICPKIWAILNNKKYKTPTPEPDIVLRDFI